MDIKIRSVEDIKRDMIQGVEDPDKPLNIRELTMPVREEPVGKVLDAIE